MTQTSNQLAEGLWCREGSMQQPCHGPRVTAAVFEGSDSLPQRPHHHVFSMPTLWPAQYCPDHHNCLGCPCSCWAWRPASWCWSCCSEGAPPTP
jgi:hypothetical protein